MMILQRTFHATCCCWSSENIFGGRKISTSWSTGWGYNHSWSLRLGLCFSRGEANSQSQKHLSQQERLFGGTS